MLLVPAAFTEVTGRAHWEILIRARAIENQAFVVAADQVGPHPPDKVSFGGSMIVDPWGEVLARAPDEECFVAADLDLERQDEVREKLPSLANRVPDAYRRPGRGGLLMATAPRQAPVDKRRLILDAAVRVFARQGFHHCRVSDVADEAGVAYGLVYHYFDSKEEILNTLFLERWEIMLEAIAEIDARDLPVREKLYSIAGFIIDSYRHDPDLMKVIIVEVTRAANSFGAHAPRQDPRGLRPHRVDPRVGARERLVQVRDPGRLRGHVLLRRDRAAAHRLDLRAAAHDRRGIRARQGPGGRGHLRRTRDHARGAARRLCLNHPRWATT